MRTEVEGLATALEAFLTEEVEVAKNSHQVHRKEGPPIWSDEIWRESDPDGFERAQNARSALAAYRACEAVTVEGLDLDALEKVAREAYVPRIRWCQDHAPTDEVLAVDEVSKGVAVVAKVNPMAEWTGATAVSWGAHIATFEPPTVLHLLTALRAQAERVRVLEGERDDTLVRWCARMAEIREASGVGVKPMLDEVPGAIAERIAAAEARPAPVVDREAVARWFAARRAADTDQGDPKVMPWDRDDADAILALLSPATSPGEGSSSANRAARIASDHAASDKNKTHAEDEALYFGGEFSVTGSAEAIRHLVGWYDALKALSPIAYVLQDLSDCNVVIQINGPGRHRQMVPGPTWGAFLRAQQIVAKQRVEIDAAPALTSGER